MPYHVKLHPLVLLHPACNLTAVNSKSTLSTPVEFCCLLFRAFPSTLPLLAKLSPEQHQLLMTAVPAPAAM